MIKLYLDTKIITTSNIPFYLSNYKFFTLDINETEDLVTFNFTFNKHDDSTVNLVKNFNKLEYANSIVKLSLVRDSSKDDYKDISVLRKYSNVDDPYISGSSVGEFSFARVYFGNDTIYVIPRFNFKDTYTTNGETILMDFNGKSSQEVLFTISPSALNIRNKWVVKKESVGDMLDVKSSISYLESQVDLLYKIIEKSGIDISEYKNIFDAVDRTSCLKVKDENHIINEMLTNKQLVRTRQELYRRKLKELNNSSAITSQE
jgi:hypothetical protein